MKTTSQQLIADLKAKVESLLARTHSLKTKYSRNEIFQRPANNGWSAAECLEHLALYGDYYHPAIKNAIEKAKRNNFASKPAYQSGWFGEYFTNSVGVKKGGKINKMKSPKDKNPAKLEVPEGVVQRFIEQQQELLGLLEQAEKVNLEKARVPISIAQWLKLRLGDTLRFLIAHEERHLLQAEKALDSISEKRSISA